MSTFTLSEESVMPLTLTVNVRLVENDVLKVLVRHMSLVGESEMTLHEAPSLKVKL